MELTGLLLVKATDSKTFPKAKVLSCRSWQDGCIDKSKLQWVSIYCLGCPQARSKIL